MAARDLDFEDWLREHLAGLGPLEFKRMFGAGAVYSRGLIFALLDDGVVWLKADETNIPALEAAGAIRGAVKAAGLRVENLILHLGAAQRGGQHSVAHLNRLHRVNGQNRPSQDRIEPPVVVHVSAQPRRYALNQHFKDAAEGVAEFHASVDLFDHLVRGLRIQTP